MMSESPTQVLGKGLNSMRRARPDGGPSNQEPETPTATSPPEKSKTKGRAPVARNLLTASAAIWFGLFMVAVGFCVIIYSWVRVAGLLDVALQMPYVVSGAASGLAAIIIGVGVVDMAVRRQDRLERRQQMLQISEVLHELRSQVENTTPRKR